MPNTGRARACWSGPSCEVETFVFTFVIVCHYTVRYSVRLLGPCFKTGRNHENSTSYEEHLWSRIRLSPGRFQALFNSFFKVLFNFPSWYLFAIGLSQVFSLGWGLPPASCYDIAQHYSKSALPCFHDLRTGLSPSLASNSKEFLGRFGHRTLADHNGSEILFGLGCPRFSR